MSLTCVKSAFSQLPAWGSPPHLVQCTKWGESDAISPIWLNSTGRGITTHQRISKVGAGAFGVRSSQLLCFRWMHARSLPLQPLLACLPRKPRRSPLPPPQRHSQPAAGHPSRRPTRSSGIADYPLAECPPSACHMSFFVSFLVAITYFLRPMLV